MREEINLKIKNVAANIRRIRENRNYTQEYLALRLGISQNAYSKIELGYTKITVERLFHIAAILDAPITDLIGLTTPEAIAMQAG